MTVVIIMIIFLLFCIHSLQPCSALKLKQTSKTLAFTRSNRNSNQTRTHMVVSLLPIAFPLFLSVGSPVQYLASH